MGTSRFLCCTSILGTLTISTPSVILAVMPAMSILAGSRLVPRWIFAFSAVEGEEVESGFIDAGAVDDTADSEGAVLSVPVNAEVFFLGTGKGEVDHVVGGCVEDVGPRLKVNTFCERGFADCETVKAQPFNCA
jgi:hypothetical protein